MGCLLKSPLIGPGTSGSQPLCGAMPPNKTADAPSGAHRGRAIFMRGGPRQSALGKNCLPGYSELNCPHAEREQHASINSATTSGRITA